MTRQESMVMEDMIGDPDNVSKYGNFNKTCSSGNQNASDLHTRMKKKWDDKLQEKNLIKVNNKDRKPKWVPQNIDKLNESHINDHFKSLKLKELF